MMTGEFSTFLVYTGLLYGTNLIVRSVVYERIPVTILSIPPMIIFR